MPALVSKIISRAQLDFSTDSSLDIDIVNEYVRKVASSLRIMTAWASTTSVANQQTYYVSGGAPILNVCWGTGDTSKSRLVKISEDELIGLAQDVWDSTDTDNTGTPELWWGIYGGATADPVAHGKYGFALFPIPDVTGTTIRYLVNFADAEYTTTTAYCELPDRAIDVVVSGCMFERARRVQPEKSKLLYEAYELDLKECQYLMLQQKGPFYANGETAYDYGISE